MRWSLVSRLALALCQRACSCSLRHTASGLVHNWFGEPKRRECGVCLHTSCEEMGVSLYISTARWTMFAKCLGCSTHICPSLCLLAQHAGQALFALLRSLESVANSANLLNCKDSSMKFLKRECKIQKVFMAKRERTTFSFICFMVLYSPVLCMYN